MSNTTGLVDYRKIIVEPLADLKSHELLDLTLEGLLKSDEQPYRASGNGRDHNPWGYTQWLAGGCSNAGHTYARRMKSG
jgi:hypothetical protein